MSEEKSKAKKIIKELTEKIDELLEQSDISKEDVKKEIDARIRELKKSRDQLNEELRTIKEDNKETIEKVEKLARNTAKEIKSAFSGFMRKFSEPAEKGKGTNKKDEEK